MLNVKSECPDLDQFARRVRDQNSLDPQTEICPNYNACEDPPHWYSLSLQPAVEICPVLHDQAF